MKRLKLALVIVTYMTTIAVLPACHPNPGGGPLTQAQVHQILINAGFGVEFGCMVEWLPPAACVIARQALGDAQVAVENASGGWQAAAKAVLVREEANLPTNSRLRPYFDAAIILL